LPTSPDVLANTLKSGIVHDESYISGSSSDEEEEYPTTLAEDLDEFVSSVMIESTGFQMNNEDQIILMSNQRDINKFNIHLTKIEREIYEAVKYSDTSKLIHLGCNDNTDVNFEIEIKKNLFYPLLLLAASIGDSEVIELLLENKTIDINRKEKTSMVNAFWVAAFYGRGNAMNQLASANANVL
jgi:hypothetical protein